MSSSQRFYADYEKSIQGTNERSKPKSTNTSATSSAASSRTSSAVSLEPSAPVAEWCHQLHQIQNRQYEWCQGCYPKVSTLKVPSQKILRQQRTNHEPGHAYQ
ncbi:hypothetical protein HRR83_003095 [Exophiala dermatitidis]|uniref:Uncharacterized protein n=1 Tax=Exophiala dermatitidis TaxID=5970 RepID=A0AAN6IRA2_EXODE|nr:hypothetical protein HRR73_008160 [Exophiala dermatitidis]KAJ4506943.1 hypothetical protein HRR74_008259 [Exophiala dermatitidis]KAJ4547945.1 hypothetical protein HRR76_000565 [Exophiala dermatitidis]KAJ4553885.1 hypothetical protein HRR77_002255 [Exophiala dermatitidis]KAJ4580147.1 hypothetical protein HRR81_002311 [Exophiala dermatitidis]